MQMSWDSGHEGKKAMRYRVIKSVIMQMRIVHIKSVIMQMRIAHTKFVIMQMIFPTEFILKTALVVLTNSHLIGTSKVRSGRAC